MYQYLFFDLDGTLTNPKEGITKCVQYALRHFGIEEPDLDKLEPFIGPPLVDSFREYYGMSLEQAKTAVEKYRERFRDVGIFENEVLEGIPQMLENLKRRGACLAVASSKPEGYVRQILDKFELASYFTQVVGATMDEKRTAKAEVIQEAFARLSIGEKEKPRVLMIGDRRHDVEGARACGIDSLGVYIGFAAPGELEAAGATYIAHSVGEMAEFLAAHLSDREHLPRTWGAGSAQE